MCLRHWPVSQVWCSIIPTCSKVSSVTQLIYIGELGKQLCTVLLSSVGLLWDFRCWVHGFQFCRTE